MASTSETTVYDKFCDFCGVFIKKASYNYYDPSPGEVHYWSNYCDLRFCSEQCEDSLNNFRFSYGLENGIPYYITVHPDFKKYFTSDYIIPENIEKGICYYCGKNEKELIFFPVGAAFYEDRCEGKGIYEDYWPMFFCRDGYCLSNLMIFMTDITMSLDNFAEYYGCYREIDACGELTYNELPYILPYIVKKHGKKMYYCIY